MIDFKKMSETELKKLVDVQKVKNLENMDLAALFGKICIHMFKYENATKVEDYAEYLFWKTALELVDKEICERNFSVSFISLTEGQEAESIMDLLENPDFDLELETVLSTLDLQMLIKIEKAFSEAVTKEPKKFKESLLIIQSEIQQRTVRMN